jgi:exonuclease VII large subunit
MVKDKETLCPSCGRFVGTYLICQHCGENIEKRKLLVFLKYFSVIGSILGLIILYVLAKNTPFVDMKIKDIKKTMNFGQIRVKGKAVADTLYLPEKNFFTFSLEDGTGRISVIGFGETVRSLAENDKLPQEGDTVEVVGTLQIKKEGTTLILQFAERLDLVRKPVVFYNISDLDESIESKRVKVKGKISNAFILGKDKGYRFILDSVDEDIKSSTSFILWNNTFERIEDKNILGKNSIVEVVGTVDVYKERVSLNVASAFNIKSLSKGKTFEESYTFEKKEYQNYQKINKLDYFFMPFDKITQNDKSKIIRFKGKLEKSYKLGKSGIKFIISDDNAKLSLIIWNKVLDSIVDKDILSIGNVIEGIGKIDYYEKNNELQLVLLNNDVELIEKGEGVQNFYSTSSNYEKKSIKEVLDSSVVNDLVIIKGNIKKKESLQSLDILDIEDETGKIAAVIFSKTRDKIKFDYDIDSNVTIYGKFSIYKEEKQIIINRFYSNDNKSEEKKEKYFEDITLSAMLLNGKIKYHYKFKAKIDSIKVLDSLDILEISSEDSKIEAVIFKGEKAKLNSYKVGDEYIFKGQYQLYKEKKQLKIMDLEIIKE